MEIMLTGNKILAIREKKDISDGGIIIPEFSKSNDGLSLDNSIHKAKVVATGKGIRNKKTNKLIPTQIKKGDIVLFNPNKCIDIHLNGKKYIMMRETEIYGVME